MEHRSRQDATDVWADVGGQDFPWFALAITLAGLVYLFLCNGGSRGVHFLYRYFPLSVVVGWKFVAASLIVLPALKASLRGASPSVIGWSLSAALAALNLVMFLRIGHHLKTLSQYKSPAGTPP